MNLPQTILFFQFTSLNVQKMLALISALPVAFKLCNLAFYANISIIDVSLLTKPI